MFTSSPWFRVGFIASLLLLVGQGCLSLTTEETAQTSGAAGMFVSIDGGAAWQPISALPDVDGVKNLNSVSVYRLIEDPQDPNALYWASRGDGLFFSYDSGRSWQRASSPLSSGFIYGVAVHPQDKCTIYATNGASVFRSTDCSRSWAEVYQESTGDRIASIAVNPFPPHQVYIVKKSGPFLQSADGGISWQLIYTFFGDMVDIFSDPHHEGVLYLGTSNSGLFRTQDGGYSWVSLTESLSDSYAGIDEYRRFFIDQNVPGSVFYISTYGIFSSSNGGDTWQPVGLIHPPGSARIYGFGVNPQNPQELYYTATINQRSTLYKSVDGGTSWITEKLPTGQIPTALHIHPENGWLYTGFTIPPS